MIDLYAIIQHRSLKETEALVAAHVDVQVLVETEPCPPPPSSQTVVVPASPTIPAKSVA